ncbi:MAG TPA: proline dehydrogenase family protein [Acidisarcina sp.]|nr:proline dehydrogenase family protein [Acidisarcina sp.]
MPILRSTFIALSRNSSVRRFSEQSSLGRRMSSRFVAGVEIEAALRTAETLNENGITASLDSLGESVSTADEARRAADTYHQLLDAIQSRRLNANVSVKLTQMGLEIDQALAYDIVAGLVSHAASTRNFVRIDMEGSEHTQTTIDMVRKLHDTNPGTVGIVIQAYLYRSEQDLHTLLNEGIRVRLCKGAYQEPPNIAFASKKDVDENYLKLARILLNSNIFHGLATHDEKIIAATKHFLRERHFDTRRFEFQMLYGIRRDLQKSLVREGYNMRVYIPFGTEWYPYFMRRLAERPANLIFLAKNIFRS